MPEITLTESSVVVDLSKLEELASLTRSLEIPLKNVRGATVDEGILKHLGLRAPGTGLPGVIAAGTFYKDGDRQFVYWHRGETPVVIELTHEKYDRLIIGVDHPQALVDAINARIASAE